MILSAGSHTDYDRVFFYNARKEEITEGLITRYIDRQMPPSAHARYTYIRTLMPCVDHYDIGIIV